MPEEFKELNLCTSFHNCRHINGSLKSSCIYTSSLILKALTKWTATEVSTLIVFSISLKMNFKKIPKYLLYFKLVLLLLYCMFLFLLGKFLFFYKISSEGYVWNWDMKLTRDNDFRLSQGRFRLDISKNFSSEKLVMHWKRLPRGTVESSSTEAFKKCRESGAEGHDLVSMLVMDWRLDYTILADFSNLNDSIYGWPESLTF